MKKKNIIKKVKSIIIGILIGVIAFPTITIGGSFISSLIAGKTPAEAIQILGEQIDVLIGRIDVVETKQTEQKQTIQELQGIISQQEICKEYQELIANTSRETTTEEIKLGEFRNPLVGVDLFIALAQEILQNYDLASSVCPNLLEYYPKPKLQEILIKTIQQRSFLKTAYENCNERNKYRVNFNNANFSHCVQF